jgi:hypothetical protein
MGAARAAYEGWEPFPRHKPVWQRPRRKSVRGLTTGEGVIWGPPGVGGRHKDLSAPLGQCLRPPLGPRPRKRWPRCYTRGVGLQEQLSHFLGILVVPGRRLGLPHAPPLGPRKPKDRARQTPAEVVNLLPRGNHWPDRGMAARSLRCRRRASGVHDRCGQGPPSGPGPPLTPRIGGYTLTDSLPPVFLDSSAAPVTIQAVLCWASFSRLLGVNAPGRGEGVSIDGG